MVHVERMGGLNLCRKVSSRSHQSIHFQLRIVARVDLVSAATSGAKILLHVANESADVFAPLKSVLGGICAVCDQYEVCLRTPTLNAVYLFLTWRSRRKLLP